jgi:protein O-mannosyl-transferase
VCVLVAAGTLVYANGLSAPFIFDDTAIAENPYIQSLSSLTQAMRAPVQSAFAGRPMVSLSLAVSYAVGGMEPTAFRIWNVAVLVASALVLAGLIRRTWRRLGHNDSSATLLSGAIALIWLVHPLNTEVVGYVTQRTESMMGLFYLLTVYCASRAMTDMDEGRGGAMWAGLSIASCASGMACKESMVTAPVMVLLYDTVFCARSPLDALKRRKMLYLGLAVTWVLLAFFVAGGPRSRSAGFSTGVSAWTYLLNQAPMIVTYLARTLWPHPLVLDYGRTHPATLTSVLPSAIFVVMLLLAVAAAWVFARPAAYLGTWFFVTLAPSSSILPIATEVGAERRMYLPLAAVVALVVFAVRAAAGRWLEQRQGEVPETRPGRPQGARSGNPARLRTTSITALVIVVLALAARTAVRSAEYQDPIAIWESVLRHRPHGRAHHNLAIVLKERGRTAEAIEHYRAAADAEPAAHYALGFEAGSAGQFEAAAGHLQEFLRLDPDDILAPKASFLLGQALARIGKPAEAERAFRETLRMSPRDADARVALADVLVSEERYDEAIPLYREYLTMQPQNAGAHHNLALALVATEKDAEALPEFERAVALVPSDANLRMSLGHTLASMGRLDEAVAEYRKGLERAPSNARLMSALALALAASGDVNESLALFRRALQLQPDDPEIRSDYAAAMERLRTMHR